MSTSSAMKSINARTLLLIAPYSLFQIALTQLPISSIFPMHQAFIILS